MTFLMWLVRAIVVTIIINLILRLIFGRSASSRTSATSGRVPRGTPSQPRLGGTLVQDPQCGTYIMESRAVRIGSGADVRYFCSDGCRTAYLAAHPQ